MSEACKSAISENISVTVSLPFNVIIIHCAWYETYLCPSIRISQDNQDSRMSRLCFRENRLRIRSTVRWYRVVRNGRNFSQRIWEGSPEVISNSFRSGSISGSLRRREIIMMIDTYNVMRTLIMSGRRRSGQRWYALGLLIGNLIGLRRC